MKCCVAACRCRGDSDRCCLARHCSMRGAALRWPTCVSADRRAEGMWRHRRGTMLIGAENDRDEHLADCHPAQNLAPTAACAKLCTGLCTVNVVFLRLHCVAGTIAPWRRSIETSDNAGCIHPHARRSRRRRCYCSRFPCAVAKPAPLLGKPTPLVAVCALRAER